MCVRVRFSTRSLGQKCKKAMGVMAGFKEELGVLEVSGIWTLYQEKLQQLKKKSA